MDSLVEAILEEINTADNDVIIMFMNLKTYENEFKLMKMFYTDTMLAFTRTSPLWNILHKWNSPSDLTSKSIRLREQGNKLFKASPKEHALEACRFYTKAIFAANLGSEELALAHANRAVALQEFGYFQQAYDDCDCALEQGYPMKSLHKIIARQAYCAQQMGNKSLLKQHLDTLRKFNLNKNFMAQMEQLQQGFHDLLITESNDMENDLHDLKNGESIKLIRKTSKEGYMISEKPIQKDEIVFSERATSFVPSEEKLICQQCAATQLIPFPCYRCHGNVIYCSSKCRVAHQPTHAYECVAYQKTLYPDDSIRHLPLRILLDGLPQALPLLSEKRTASEIWDELTNEGSKLMQNDRLEYAHSLRMMTQLEKEPLKFIFKMAQVSNVLTGYLRRFTDFFNIFNHTKASLKDWEIIIASLILRHTGQILYNNIKIMTLDVKISDPLEFTLLSSKLWQSPSHIRRGLLHKFSHIKAVGYANFPSLTFCRNVCYPSNLLRFSGKSFSLIANKNIKTGEEIFINYCCDSRMLRRSERELNLKLNSNIKCKCVECKSEHPDKNYDNLRRFICENPRCRQTYTPNITENCDCSILEWINFLRCTKCNVKQHNFSKSLQKFISMLLVPDEKIMLCEPFKHCNALDRWLLHPHSLKSSASLKLVRKCFAAYDAGANLSYKDFSQIAELIKYNLQYKVASVNLKSIDYVATMTYIWDLIALGKYQCKREEMLEMLQAIEIISDEMKIIFNNYYNDFIAGK